MSGAPLIAIVGATGSGKSDLSLRICEQLGGEVVNCDSLQIYRYFDIGTAKTPPSERRGIPHHMLDILNPDETFTAGEYANRARPLLASISLSALPLWPAEPDSTYGRCSTACFQRHPQRRDARVWRRARAQTRIIHRLLRRFDPAAARAIHLHDI